jgi:Zn-dependent protease with chaperone function
MERFCASRASVSTSRWFATASTTATTTLMSGIAVASAILLLTPSVRVLALYNSTLANSVINKLVLFVCNVAGWTRAVALTCFHSLTLSLLLIVGVIALSCRLYKKMASRWQGRRRTRHRSLDHLAPVAEIQQVCYVDDNDDITHVV